MPARPTSNTAQPEFHFAAPVVTPLGDGSYRVTPGKPVAGVEEISTEEAAAICSLGTTAMRAAKELRLGQQILKWRYTSETQRVIVWEKPSVLAYKEATKLIGK